MPLFEYECDACKRRFEVLQKRSDPLVDTCPSCGGSVHKCQSAPAFQFKGTGWYVTDYAKKDQTGGKEGESRDGAKTSGKDASKEGPEKNDKSDKSDKSEKTGDSAKSAASTDSASGSATGPTPASSSGSAKD